MGLATQAPHYSLEVCHVNLARFVFVEHFKDASEIFYFAFRVLIGVHMNVDLVELFFLFQFFI